MIALAFEFQAVRLRQNRANLILVEVAYLRNGCLFGRYSQDRGALCNRQRFTVCEESNEAVQRRQSAVPGSNRGLANLFDVVQKRENLDCREILSGRAMALGGLRMMPRFPSPPSRPGEFAPRAFPACFMSRLTWPILLVGLSARVRYRAMAYSTSGQPKPFRFRARIKCRRIFFSTRSLTNEKHRLECPTAK